MRNHISCKRFFGVVGLAGLGVAVLVGCERRAQLKLSVLPPSKAEMAGYYLPSQIEILPFTKVGSFDAKGVPDGINAVVRPTDVLGDPVKAYGTMRFELYEHVAGSGLAKGQQLMVWDQDLGTPADQSKYWDRITQTYQFRLAWRQPLAPNRKYVLAVVYENPAGVRLAGDYIFEFAPNVSQLREEFRGAGR